MLAKIYDFLEIDTDFMYLGAGDCTKTGYLTKCSGSSKLRGSCHNLIAPCRKVCCVNWRKNMFGVDKEGIFYMTDDEGVKSLSDVIPFDSKMNIKVGKNNAKNYQFLIETSATMMDLRCESLLSMIDWLKHITSNIRNSPLTGVNRYKSFAPIRENNMIKPYICGHEYFTDLCDALDLAQFQIFITDWMFNPEMYLKRPVEGNEETQLWKVLLRAAERGVKVCVMLYKEFSQGMMNNSEHSEKFLEQLHPNIEVSRHPMYTVWFWSHHEKLVCIDQYKLFCGGLDLCWGRWEYPGYHLFEPIPGKTVYPGQDYYNFRIHDYTNPEKWDICDIEYNVQPRCPWRDIAGQFQGYIVKDAVRHFIQYWNYAKRCLEEDDNKLSAVETMAGMAMQDTASSYFNYFSAVVSGEDTQIPDAPANEVTLVNRADIVKEKWMDAIYRVIIENCEKNGKSTIYWKMRWMMMKMQKKPRFNLMVTKDQFDAECKGQKEDTVHKSLLGIVKVSKDKRADS